MKLPPPALCAALSAAFIMILSIAARAATIPERGLAGFWRFEETRERTVADRSPTKNPLRLESEAVVDSQGGPASLRCSGPETAARLEEKRPVDWSAGMTLAVWARPERATRTELVVGRPQENPNYGTPAAGLFFSELCPGFGMMSHGKTLLIGEPVRAREWTLVAVTLDGSTAKLWVDGKLAAEGAQTGAVPDAKGLPWYVGRGAGQYFLGRIGEVLVWSRALDASEIEEVMAATKDRYGRPSPVETPRWRDETVAVSSPGTQADAPWRDRPTRTLSGLDGFAAPKPPRLDRYGGRLDRPALRATGFFRTERVDGRWWLVTPDGHLYWNMAINAVEPPRGTSADEKRDFAARATKELREIGFNGLGNRSLPALRDVAEPLPWCIRLSFAAEFARERGKTYNTAGHAGFLEDCIPVFHPDFASWAERHAAERLKPLADDRFAIGVFTDNELQCSVDLLDRHLRLDPADPYLGHGYRAAVAWLKGRGRPADVARLDMRDRYEFIAHVFGTYSRVVHDAVRKHDKNHLILGSRFFVQAGEFDNPWFWPAVGRWIDVIGINYYGRWGTLNEEIAAWSEAAGGRPLMITEWYSKALDVPGLANTKGGGWLLRTQADRGMFYQHFVLSALESPVLVGAHYFKYGDDPASAKALDAVGGANKGFYAVDGRPWPPLVERAEKVNQAMYPLIDFFDARRSARPAGRAEPEAQRKSLGSRSTK